MLFKKPFSQKNQAAIVLNQKGQSMIEYLLLTALIAIGSFAVVRTLGHSVSGKFAQITKAIQGRDTNVKFESVQDGDYKKKDMEDFMNGAVSGK